MTRHPASITVLVLLLALLTGCGGDPGDAPAGADGPDPLHTPSPLDVFVTLDEGRAVNERVPLEGGTITATAEDGTVYTLTIPPDALRQETEVTLRPITVVKGAPVSGGRLAGVDLAPDGLRLYRHATLDVTPSGPSPGVDALAFSYREDGRELHLFPLDADPSRLRFNLLHFSGRIAYLDTGEGTQLAAPPGTFMPTDWESQLQHTMAELIAAERAAQLLGEEGDPELAGKLEALLRAYYEAVVAPMLPGVAGDCPTFEAGNGKVLGWGRTAELLGLEETFSHEIGAITDAVTAGADNCWQEAIQPCVDQGNPEQVSEVVSIARMNLLLGGDPARYDPFDPALQCGCAAEMSAIQSWTGAVTLDFEDSASEGDATITIRRSLDVTFRLQRTGMATPGQSPDLPVRWSGGVTGGTGTVEEVLSYAGGSGASVTGSGAPDIAIISLTMRPRTCTYELLVQWSTPAMHSPTGVGHGGIGGRFVITEPLTSSGLVFAVSGSRAVPSYYFVGRPAGENEHQPGGTYIGILADYGGSDRFADALVTWDLRAEDAPGS